MEEIYTSLSQTGSTLDDIARNEGPHFGRQRQHSVELGSQEYLDGLVVMQDAIARTSFRKPKVGDRSPKNQVGSGSSAKFEHLGKTPYSVGAGSESKYQSGVSASSQAATGRKLSRGKNFGLAKSSKTSAKSGETQRGHAVGKKFEATIRSNHSRDGAISNGSGDSSDELNLTSSSQPIRSPKKLYTPFSDAGTAPPESDSDDQDIHRDLSSFVASGNASSSSIRKLVSHPSKWRPRHDENSFSDETPEKKKLKVKPLIAYSGKSRLLLDEALASPTTSKKGSKSRFGTSRNAKLKQSDPESAGEGETPQSSRISVKKRPAPFPMNKLTTINSSGPVPRETQKPRLAPFPMSMEVADDCAANGRDGNKEESGSDEDPLLMSRNDEIINRGGLAPFPMSLNNRPGSTDSDFAKGSTPSSDRSSRLVLGQNRRESNGVRDVQDINERSFTQADDRPDPKTLCPYCDMAFPPSPTPLLVDMLKRIPKYPDPRPTNPLGLKAPLLSYVSMCQRHQFEMQLLPKARAAGWPTFIDFAALPGRISALQRRMSVLLRDKEKSVFWRELKTQIDKHGARKTMGITNQFDSFEKSQPGYYGEQGAVIITQALSNLFPPESLDPNRLAPLTPMEFIRCVLVPECAVALIQEDLGSDTSKEHAIRTLRKSSKYGTAMFPDLDNRDATSIGEGGGTGQQVGEAIVKERIRARLVEISEEEREAEGAGTSLAVAIKRKGIANKQRVKAKAPPRPARNNDLGHTIELSDSSSVQTDAPNRRRKANDRVKSDTPDLVSPSKSSRKPPKQSHEKAVLPKTKPRAKAAYYNTTNSVYSSTESFRSNVNDATPKPRSRTYGPYDSDSGIVLPEEDNRYEKPTRRSTVSKTPRLHDSFRPLQVVKARQAKSGAVVERTTWESDDENDVDKNDTSSANTSVTNVSHKGRATALGRSESHSWLFSDPSTPSSTPQH